MRNPYDPQEILNNMHEEDERLSYERHLPQRHQAGLPSTSTPPDFTRGLGRLPTSWIGRRKAEAQLASVDLVKQLVEKTDEVLAAFNAKEATRRQGFYDQA